MLHLPNITLVTIDTAENALTAFALAKTLEKITPGNIVIFSNDLNAYTKLNLDPAETVYRVIPNNLNTTRIYQTLWYEVPKYVNTSHILTVQWDGWVTTPDLWTNEFLNYDYIGAPWPWHEPNVRVGNGGFSLRSKKLLDLLNTERRLFPFQLPTDVAICCLYRPQLESFGIKFAPENLAWRFSVEHGNAIFDLNSPSFGFHDPRNIFTKGLRNWKPAIDEFLSLCGPYAKNKLTTLGVIKNA